VLQIVIVALLFMALSPLVYYLLSLYCVIGYFRRWRNAPTQKTPFMPPASIIKPVRGLDRESYENFASFCSLDYPEYEVVFAVTARHGSDTHPLLRRNWLGPSNG
jgi:ceramide glucosyltransferase